MMATKEQSFETDATCQLETLSRVYRVKLVGYSQIKNFDTCAHVKLSTFDLTGHSLAVNYTNSTYSGNHYLKFFIRLLTETSTPLNVEYEFCLLDESGKSSTPQKKNQSVKKMGDDFGVEYLMKKSEFESLGYLKNDWFVVHCTLQVVEVSCMAETKKQTVEPSSDLYHHFGKLLESREGTDVTFEVNEEKFVAHKTVLAARSPVFKAQFFGSMAESESNSVKIEDVTPDIFKLMLHFIYTDMLPEEIEISSEIAQHLLVVADRYDLERLKFISGEILCANLNVESSATTLVLAEQHNCQQLKKVCMEFVSSRKVLNQVVTSDGFNHLMESCPILIKELFEKVDNRR